MIHMKDDTFMKHHSKLKAFISILSICIGTSTLADAKHGIAMYGCLLYTSPSPRD